MAQPPTAPPTVPAWVDSRLQAIVSVIPPIHFEHSMYGPLTAYLHTFFPPNQSFMIKPQGMLRPEHHPFDRSGFSDIGPQDQDDAPGIDIKEWLRQLRQGDVAADPQVRTAPAPSVHNHRRSPMDLDIFMDVDSESDGEGDERSSPGPNTSFVSTDSHGAGAKRTSKGGSDGDKEGPGPAPGPDTSFASNDSYGARVKRTNKGIRYPDFIIVKATQTLVDDRILLVVEVKKDDDSLQAARLQIRNYLKMAAKKRRARFLQGLLILGAVTECYFLDSGSISDPVSLVTTSPQLKARIHAVAMANW